MPKYLAQALHYGSSALLIGLAGLAYFGIQLPGVHVDPNIAFTSGLAGLGILGAGFLGPTK